MKNIKTIIFEVSGSNAIESITAKISEHYRFVEDKTKRTKQSYFDTFDYRLYNKNLLVVKEQNSFILQNYKNERKIATLQVVQKTNPRFWWEFEDGVLKNELKSILDLRALIPILSIQKTVRPFRILNKDEKTVMFLNYELVKSFPALKSSQPVEILSLQPIRGYVDESNRLAKLLTELGLRQSHADNYNFHLKLFGKRPPGYSSKLNIVLRPQMTTKSALIKILAHLLKTMKQNEDGIKKDIDTEFLHDFRVAVRRTRSALTLVKGVFNKESLNAHKSQITKLGKATNLLRDLDVYLLKKDQYTDMVPEDLHPGLQIIFEKLAQERATTQIKVKRFLNSRNYNNIINNWESFLRTEAEVIGSEKNSNVQIITLAKTIIWKKYKQIISAGRKIDDLTPDEQLHSLRIECKKMRYMLEFFSSLFPKNQIGSIIRHLKKLQDNLGDFNDLCVQQQSLKEFGQKFDSGSKNITISIGGLIAVLYQKQNETRKEFTGTFKEFNSDENAKLFTMLFSHKGSE